MQKVLNAAKAFLDVLKEYIEEEEKSSSRTYDSEGYELRKAHIEIVGVMFIVLKKNIEILAEAMRDQLSLDD